MICVYVAFPFWLLKEWFASCVRKTKSVCNSSTKRSSRTTGLNISAILTVLFQFAFQATYWQCSWQSLSQIGKPFWCVLPESRHTPPRVVHDPSEAKKNGYKMNPCHGNLRTSAAVLGVTVPPTYRWKIHHCKCQETSNWWCWYWCLGCSSPSHSLKASRNHDDVSWNKGFVFFKQASTCFQGLSNLSTFVFTWYHFVSDVFQKPCHL